MTLYGDGLWVTLLGYYKRSVFPLQLFLGTFAYYPYLLEHYVSADEAGASRVLRKPNVSNPRLHRACFMVVDLNARTVPRTRLWRTVVVFWGFLPVKNLRPRPPSCLAPFCCDDGSALPHSQAGHRRLFHVYPRGTERFSPSFGEQTEAPLFGSTRQEGSLRPWMRTSSSFSTLLLELWGPVPKWWW